MPDRDDVIAEIVEHIEATLAVDSEYVNIPLDLLQYALSLLKEQEDVEPIIADHITFGTSRKCSKCNRYLFPAGRYCPHCGKKVKWE